MAKVIEQVPGISLKGISKEVPWPGARCGWAEFYNRHQDYEFNKLCQTIDSAKMIEVSSTTLPQRAIPKIMTDPRYNLLLKKTNKDISERSKKLYDFFSDIPYININLTNGAFYNTIIFKRGALKPEQQLSIRDPKIKKLLTSWITPAMPLDQRFVYYLLAAKQVCVVPISAFHTPLLGFRITLLEENLKDQLEIFIRIKEGIMEYCSG